MFSVIIPVYNKAAYLDRCLRSVAEQTCRDFELIVVDDGSTDNPGEIIRNCDLQELAFRMIVQENGGVSTARNNGVIAAKHDFIAFLDADDWWEPGYLASMKELIESCPEAGIFGSNYFIVKNGINRKAAVAVNPGFSSGLIDYFATYAANLTMPLWTGAVVVRKSLFMEENGFRPYLKLGEDFDLWVRIALKHSVAFLNIPLSHYNQDSAPAGRAVGRLHDPSGHVLWNLGYLAEEEQNNRTLKQLLDNLRVYSLHPYYLSRKNRVFAKKELEKVDWSGQPARARWRYRIPPVIGQLQDRFMKVGSLVKTALLK